MPCVHRFSLLDRMSRTLPNFCLKLLLTIDEKVFRGGSPICVHLKSHQWNQPQEFFTGKTKFSRKTLFTIGVGFLAYVRQIARAREQDLRCWLIFFLVRATVESSPAWGGWCEMFLSTRSRSLSQSARHKSSSSRRVFFFASIQRRGEVICRRSFTSFSPLINRLQLIVNVSTEKKNIISCDWCFGFFFLARKKKHSFDVYIFERSSRHAAD